MSFLGYKKFLEDEDQVIVYLNHNNLMPLKLCKGKITQTKYGALKHHDLIGEKYGTRVRTHGGKGWVYILHPTPELWTVTLPHRTQILYFADISLITFELELKPGSRVAEAGTGSGSLSHSLARTVAPDGHLFTYEFHEHRAGVAAEEFASHGLSGVVTLANRDVIKDGFNDDITVDAVFLDLPSPWLVVPHAKKILKTDGGRICSFSPCIEQVQKTCKALSDAGFTETKTNECLLRPFDIRFTCLPEPNLGFPPKVAKSPAVGPAQAEKSGDAAASDRPDDVKLEDTETRNQQESFQAKKKMKLDKDATSDFPKRRAKDPVPGQKCAVPCREIVGHSGYLTFATLYEFKT